MEVKEQYSMPRCDIEELKSEIKHLKDLQAKKDKEVESLRDLLKECRDGYVSTDLDDDLLLNQDMARDLVTRINAVIGESEE